MGSELPERSRVPRRSIGAAARTASGLYYYRARYYLPEVGRFLTPDPTGLSGGSNPYTYVGSNPVNFRDPFGLLSTSSKLTYSNAISPIDWSAFSASPSRGDSIGQQALGGA